MFLFKALFGGKPCVVLFDTGATFSFVSASWLSRWSSYVGTPKPFRGAVVPLDRVISVATAENRILPLRRECRGVVEIQRLTLPVAAKVLPSVIHGIDLILGMDWLRAHHISLQCGAGTCLCHKHGKPRTLVPFEPETGDLLSAALPSRALQASLETPLLSPKEAAHELKRGAPSWLMLVQPAHTAPDFLASVQSGEHSGGHTQGLLPQTEIDKIVEEYQDVFTPKEGCPPYRFDLSHTIRLQPGTAPPYRRPYRLSPVEAQEVERQKFRSCWLKA